MYTGFVMNLSAISGGVTPIDSIITAVTAKSKL